MPISRRRLGEAAIPDPTLDPDYWKREADRAIEQQRPAIDPYFELDLDNPSPWSLRNLRDSQQAMLDKLAFQRAFGIG